MPIKWKGPADTVDTAEPDTNRTTSGVCIPTPVLDYNLTWNYSGNYLTRSLRKENVLICIFVLF